MTPPLLSPDPVASDSPLQLLVVDDDDLDRERVRRMLAQITLRCAVTEVDSVNAAKAELGHHEFDCIFLDYHLGDAIGTELVDAIGSIVKCPPPIVMITGAGDERTAVSALQQGVYDYIPKRLLRSDLLETVLTSSLQRARLEKEIRTQQERLEYLSLYDSLTGLPNRSLFFDRLNRELKIAQRTGRPFAVLQIDLNLFKEINDRYGHAAGDAVLTEAAQRFKSALRDIDTVARLGGDEFAAILTDVGTPEAAIIAASKLQLVLTEPIMVEDTVTHHCDLVHVGAAIGIALCPLHANTADALLVKADHAMYRAKKTDECVVFNEGMVADIDTGLTASRLQQAIEQNELFVEFQPMIDLRSRMVIGAEALVRWRSPEFGVVPPGVFIPIAERSSIINSLTDAVFDLVLDQAKTWLYTAAIPVSINLSVRLLEDPELPTRILHALTSRSLPYEILTLELTETALLTNVLQAQKTLSELSAAGVSISIDDFGAGFTSFKYLRELSISEIKIDQAFAADLKDGSRGHTIVRSIAMLAKGFGIPSVVEGIEDPLLCDLLQELGCSKGQGFGIARPMSAADFLDWLLRWEADLAYKQLSH